MDEHFMILKDQTTTYLHCHYVSGRTVDSERNSEVTVGSILDRQEVRTADCDR